MQSLPVNFAIHQLVMFLKVENQKILKAENSMFSVLFGDNSTVLIQKLLICYSGSLLPKLVPFSFHCSERESSLTKLKRKIIFFKRPLTSSKQKKAQGVLCGLLLGFQAFIVVAWIQSLVRALRSCKLCMLKTNKQNKPPLPKKGIEKKSIVKIIL